MAAVDGVTALQEPTVVAITALAGLLLALILLHAVHRGLGSRGNGGGRATPPKQRQRQAAPRQEPRGYTRAEVAAHTADGDLWLIIRNRGSEELKVYDVSQYVEHHPGGGAIFTNAGGDATEGFHGPQHPPTVFDLVEEYCIGWLLHEEGE